MIILSSSFDLLNVLIAVAESNNFRQAAERLTISQPAVSMKLRELEALHPIPLFSLEGKRKVLTHYGRSLYVIAKDGVTSLERKIEGLQRLYSDPELLTLRIGGRNEILEHLAPALHFGGRIELVDLSGQEAVNSLLRHEIDVAITYIVPDSSEIQAKKLFSSKAYFVIHSKLLARRRLSPSLARDKNFLLNTPCISYHREGHLIGDWAKHVGMSFSDLKIKFIAEDWRSIKSLVDNGTGYAIVPFYVRTGPDVQRLELTGGAVRALDYYALFERNLKKIDAFSQLLRFDGLAG